MFTGLINNFFKRNIFLSAVAILGSLIIAYIVYSPNIPIRFDISIGNPSPITIRSPQYIEFQTTEDTIKTNQLRNTRRELIEPIYSIDTSIQKNVNSDIITFFNQLRSDNKIEFINQYKIFTLSDRSFLLSLNNNELLTIESTILKSADHILKNGIKDINFKSIDRSVKLFLNNYSPSSNSVVVSKVCQQFIKPNLFIDGPRTDQIIEEQISSIIPFVTIFKSGQIIVNEGELFTQYHINVLKELKLYGSKMNIINFLGTFIICSFLFILYERFVFFFYKRLHPKFSTYLIPYLLLLLTIVISRVIYPISDLKFIEHLHFLIPVPMMIILICLLLTSNIAMISGTICSILISMMYQNDLNILLYLFFSSCVATFSCNKIYKRSDLVKAGNAIGFINICIIFAIGISTDISSSIWFLYHGIIGFTNGFLCSMLSFAFLPYLESVFKITTSLGLIETANLNHPLLKKLMLNAPGTYQHSLMVANLSEAAAEAVGADIILSRIGGYFHDIGKMKRPIFFSENQFSSGNPHDNLSPRMSKLIISAHTKDGVEMAQKYKLPKVLQDIMLEHHGTSLVSFFYSIAKQQETDDSEPSIIEDFRYPGPKPQTKESGIIMLADAVEASIRSIEKPSITKIEGLIEKVILMKITDNQLDKSGLSLNDIRLIKKTFISIFKSIYHSRLDYEEELNKIIDQTKSNYNEE